MGRIALNPCIVVGSMTPIWYPRATSEKQPQVVVFIDTKINAWGFLVNEPDCLKNSISLSSLHSRSFSRGAGYCYLLRALWGISGVASVAAVLMREQIHLASFSATRIVMLLATTWKVSRMSFDRPLSQSSTAIVWNSLANFSWKGAREIVSLA